MNINKKNHNKSYLELLPEEIPPIILRFAITTGDKPTNAALSLMYTSKFSLGIIIDLLKRDAEVHASFVKQIGRLALTWKDEAPVQFHINTFFLLWMTNFLQDKKLEVTLETIQKSEIIKSKHQEILADWLVLLEKNHKECDCTTTLELAFNQYNRLQEISSDQLLLLFSKTFSYICLNPQPKTEYIYSLSFTILLHVTRKLTATNWHLLTKRIKTEIEDYKNKNIEKLPTFFLKQIGYKLAILIEELGYYINQKSPRNLLYSYLEVIALFLDAFHSSYESFLENEQFGNLAIKFIQLMPRHLLTSSNGAQTSISHNLISDLKKISEKYEKVTSIIESLNCSKKSTL